MTCDVLDRTNCKTIWESLEGGYIKLDLCQTDFFLCLKDSETFTFSDICKAEVTD